MNLTESRAFPDSFEQDDSLGDDYCPGSDDGKHKPNPKSVTVSYDGEDVYFDVNCAACGRSGCAGRFNADDISW